MSDKVRVVLVGEYRLFRECLANRLAENGGIVIAAQAERLEQVGDVECDLLLLDVGGASPDECCAHVREVTAARPDTKLVVLGLDGSEVYAISGIADITPRKTLGVKAVKTDGTEVTFEVTARIDTDVEVDYRVFSPHQRSLFVGYGLKHKGRFGNLPFIGT